MKNLLTKSLALLQGKLFLQSRNRSIAVAVSLWMVLGCLTLQDMRTFGKSSGLMLFSDSTGTLGTYSSRGAVDTTNPFFQVLGTNGRACATCHVASDAWSVTPSHLQERFAASHGTDPIFRTVDGSNCPNSPGVNDSPPSQSAYSLLLNKGLIRVSISVPSNAQFTVAVVSDPYGCALTTDSSGQQFVSMYRRVLPSTNLRFQSSVMFDGRETLRPLNDPSTFQSNLNFDLADQALGATMGHAQAAHPPTEAQLQQIVAFELSTYTAQQVDDSAGVLNAQNARGGAVKLSSVPYYPGINDSLGGNPIGAVFNPDAFTLFSAWENLSAKNPFVQARESVARGQMLFNTSPAVIQDVKGLNDALGETTIVGTCSTCHDTPSVGNHSLSVPLDIGISDIPTGPNNPLSSALDQLNIPPLPVYALACSTSLGAPSNVTIRTSDPGRATISGQCQDIGKFKGPVLRGLAARSPYFQNGSADTLDQVVAFYNERFKMGMKANDMQDLVNFLKSL